jgi:hypothetical protein
VTRTAAAAQGAAPFPDMQLTERLWDDGHLMYDLVTFLKQIGLG